MAPIIIQRDETLSEGIIKSIRGMSTVEELLNKQGFSNYVIHGQPIGLIKKFYDGLHLNVLVTLWHDNWINLMEMQKDTEKVHNATSYLVINKLMAISSIIAEKF